MGCPAYLIAITNTLTRPTALLEVTPTSPLLVRQTRSCPNSGYFTDEDSADIATMREGIKLSRRLASSEAFAKYKGEEVFPGKDIRSDEELDLYIRNVRASISRRFYSFRVVELCNVD